MLKKYWNNVSGGLMEVFVMVDLFCALVLVLIAWGDFLSGEVRFYHIPRAPIVLLMPLHFIIAAHFAWWALARYGGKNDSAD